MNDRKTGAKGGGGQGGLNGRVGWIRTAAQSNVLQYNSCAADAGD